MWSFLAFASCKPIGGHPTASSTMVVAGVPPATAETALTPAAALPDIVLFRMETLTPALPVLSALTPMMLWLTETWVRSTFADAAAPLGLIDIPAPIAPVPL